jgi:hypothetical protein
MNGEGEQKISIDRDKSDNEREVKKAVERGEMAKKCFEERRRQERGGQEKTGE